MKKIFTTLAAKGNNLCVGLDPYKDKLPIQNARAMRYFCQGVIEAVNPYVGVVKIQSAFFEAEGSPGIHDLDCVFQDARDYGLATILDYKRGDIPDTALYYAKAGFDYYRADAVTIQPWMGESCIRTFVDYARQSGGGVFVVVAPTSAGNEGWLHHVGGRFGLTAMNSVMECISYIGSENIVNGYSDVGAVVGANCPKLREWRAEYPTIPFLVPGVGAQGGKMESLADIPGLIINVSRSILYTEGDEYWKVKIANACKKYVENGHNSISPRCSDR